MRREVLQDATNPSSGVQSRAGASPSRVDQEAERIRTWVRGLDPVSRHRIVQMIVAETGRDGEASFVTSGLALLTEAEARVASFVAAGCTNREIAARLYLSVRTVETHLAGIYRKLDIRTRTQLALLLNHA